MKTQDLRMQHLTVDLPNSAKPEFAAMRRVEHVPWGVSQYGQ